MQATLEAQWAQLKTQSFFRTRLRIYLVSQQAGYLPTYLGSTLRGAFGHAYKKTVCLVAHGECERCLLNQRCPYPYLFETPRPAETEWMTRYDKVPHPFLLHPPPWGKHQELQAGTPLNFDFSLFFQAIELLPYLILSWEEMAHRGLGAQKLKFEFKSVNRVNLQGEEQVLYQPGQNLSALPQGEDLIQAWPQFWGQGPLAMELLTPMRLKSQSKLGRVHLPFDRLLSSLLRRLSMICYFHGGYKLDLAYKELIERAKEIQALAEDLQYQSFQRYSSRQKNQMDLGGLMGKVVWPEAVREFYPLLWLGQYIQAGNNTSFGLGGYVLHDGTTDIS